jgi:hypothetical protein
MPLSAYMSSGGLASAAANALAMLSRWYVLVVFVLLVVILIIGFVGC